MPNNAFSFVCSSCGQNHTGSPSFSFASPIYFEALSDDDKKKNKLDADLCAINDHDFFIRAVLEIPIIGQDEPFAWGVWVSQSRDNFQYYVEHFNEDLSGRDTFGYFSNRLPYYQDTLELKCRVIFQSKSKRPMIHLEETDHELSVDFHQGINMEKAISIAKIAMHGKAESKS